MANQSGSHGANITADLSSFESFQRTMRSALDRQVQAAMADIEAQFQSRMLNGPQAPSIQVSVNVYYDIRSIDTQADPGNHPGRRSETLMNESMDRLNLNIGDTIIEGETGQRVAEDHRDGESVPQATTRINLPVRVPVGGIDRPAITHNPAEEARTSLRSSIAEARARTDNAFGGLVSGINRPASQNYPFEEARHSLRSSITDLLLAFDVADPDPENDCPICHETYPGISGGLDEPIVLDCDHVIGFSFMESWICGGHNSCPMCRAAVFRPDVLADLADQEEFYGRPRPTFRTAVPYVERNNLEARTQPHRQQEMLTEPANRDRLPLGASGPTATDQSFPRNLASDREQVMLREVGERMRRIADGFRVPSEEEVRSNPRAHVHSQEVRGGGGMFRFQAHR